MLSLKDIEFQYPRSSYALRIAEFTCPSGQPTALVGPSGCGKTTLLNLAAGILHPSRGEILVDGSDVSKLGASASAAFRLSRIGLIFQEFELVPHLSVRDNILLPLHLGLQADRREIVARVSSG